MERVAGGRRNSVWSTLLSSPDMFAETLLSAPSRTPKLSILVLGGAHRYLMGRAGLSPPKP